MKQITEHILPVAGESILMLRHRFLVLTARAIRPDYLEGSLPTMLKVWIEEDMDYNTEAVQFFVLYGEVGPVPERYFHAYSFATPSGTDYVTKHIYSRYSV